MGHLRILFSIVLLCSASALWAQGRFTTLANTLEAAIVDHPGLEGTVELSVSGTPVTEFVRGLGVTHQLNITIDPSVKGEVVNNFTDARVIDVLMFLCKRYDLDMEFIGSIIVLKPFVPEALPAEPPPAPRALAIVYHPDSALLDLDLRKDTLSAVARTISQLTGTNVILAPGIETRPVSVFIQGATLPGALEKLAFANSLLVERTKDGTFLLRGEAEAAPKGTERSSRGTPATNAGTFEMEVREGGRLFVDAKNIPIEQLIAKASALLDRDHFLYDALEEPATLHFTAVSYEELLKHLLIGTELTHQVSEGVHLIGKRDLEGLRRTEIVRLHHRPVKDVLAAIPEGIKKNVTIAEFIELNGIVLSGDALRIEEIKAFLRAVDQVVPVVMIEVMLVDVNRSRTLTTGIKAGLGDGPITTSGAVLPGLDLTLNSSSINDLINSFNGFGVFNLGNVAPDFYLSIQALESDGMLKLRSTPQLSTLNGHEATMSIGQTEYYLEVRNDLIGTQNPTVTTSQIYKPITADLSLKILPIVSSEDMVTLEIEVNQSSFTSRIAATAPPGSVERKFSSIVRAANKDMIILGGLEEKENSKSGSGLPFLSRVPILKWFFGSRTSKMRKSKLTIFIRPTIIY
jgi:type IV pilus assembly protein PilQ